MDAAESKRFVLDFFEELLSGQGDRAWARTAESLRWSLIASSPTYPYRADHDRASYRQMVEESAGLFPEGLRFTVLGAIAEPDRVAVEAESRGRVADGRLYNNRYHFLFELKDGKIQTVREYLDSGHAEQILGGSR